MSKRRTRIRGIPSAEHKAAMVELDAAILHVTCPYCNSGSGELCTQKPNSKLVTLRPSTNTPHIARVRAAHTYLRSQRGTGST